MVRLTLWRDDTVFERPVAGAAQYHEGRTRLFLSVEHDGFEGFGEVAPQPHTINVDPGVDSVIDELMSVTFVQLRSVVEREGALPSWTRLARFVAPRSASSWAIALVEMAILDRELRSQQLTTSALWPERFDTPTQCTVSLLAPETPWAVDGGVARVRAKTGPGTVSAHALELLSELSVPVLVDFNCSASSTAEVLDQIAQIADVATVAGVEQPFETGNLVDHAVLAAQLSVPVSLDEGVRTLGELTQIAHYGAARMICIKPARVAGLANARSMALRAVELGLTPYLGGFFESPYARHVHRLLAYHCISEPSDVGPVAVMRAPALVECERVEGGFELAPSRAVLENAKVIATLA